VLATLSLLLEVVLPVFLLVGVGAAAGRLLRLEAASINRLSLYVVVPTLVFRSMAGLSLADLPAARLVGAFALFLVSIATLAWFAGARLPTPSRRALTGTSMLGNAANMNLPVTLFALGPAGLDRALILYVVTAVTMYAVGPVLFGGSPSVGRVVRTVASFPVLWAALIGLALSRTGTALPLPLERAVDLLADAAIPLMLLILGIQLVRAGRWRPSGRVWTAVALKLALAPLLAAGIGTALGLGGVDLAALTLLAAMPTAVNTVMLSLEFGGDARQVGDTVALGTLASLATLPWVLAVVTRLP
jgi:predicted permease